MNPSENSTTVLRNEHQIILNVLDALNRFLDAGTRKGNWHWDALGECVTFFRLYADACHHGKEEDLLFPELVAKGMPREGGPIAVMLYEHQQGRQFVRAMRETLPDARAGEQEARDRFVEAGRAFFSLLTEHIGKEDHCLFAMADEMMDQTSCMGLCRKYQDVCRSQFEGETKAKLEDLAGRLEAKASSV